MNELMEKIGLQKLTEGKECPACGNVMGRALKVCWGCWPDFKYSTRTLDEFVAERKRGALQ